MTVEQLKVAGAFVAQRERREDDRGWFSRLFSARDFTIGGAPFRVTQFNCSYSRLKGTLRGLHYQVPPFEEAKLLMCTRGTLLDVVADARPGSPTFGAWSSVTLTAGDGRLVFVPPGCAHGILSLADASEAMYFTSNDFSPEHERLVRWDDPFFAIDWPFPPVVLSAKDRNAPDFRAPDAESPTATARARA